MTKYHCSFRVAKDLLPKLHEERYDKLYTIFNHSSIHCKAVDNSWEVSLFFPSDPGYYIDENLLKGLNWWEKQKSVSNIPLEYKFMSFGKIMLHDTWTLQSWLDVAKSMQELNVTIIHIDAHKDLMDPKIGMIDGKLYHLTTMKDYLPLGNNEVENAVLAGSIDQGCYIIPFLHFMNGVDLIHIVPNKCSPKIFELIPTFKTDNSLWPDVPRQTINIVPCNFNNLPNNKARSFYYSSHNHNSIQSWLAKKDQPILLHIDMDYFYNKYNRQTDWQNYNTSKVSLDSIKQKMTGLLVDILNPRIKDRIVSVDVALVPGFFPAEYWEDSIKHLETILS